MKMSKACFRLLFPLMLISIFPCSQASGLEAGASPIWSRDDMTVLRSLSLASLPPLPRDPSNAFSDNPRARELGKRIFFDARFSGDRKVSCATCHRPDMNFTDNLPQAHGMGTTSRRSMPLIGVAYNSWFFWDGRKDSLWAQALGPIESPVEHGITRTMCAHLIGEYYKREYEELFGPLPEITKESCPLIATPASGDPVALKAWATMSLKSRSEVNRLYANMGKAIAAYVRTILPQPSRFDGYVEAILDNDTERAGRILSPEEVAGLRLFIGKAKCTSCHNGPLFTNGDFHNTGVPRPSNLPQDSGREEGIKKVLSDEFNCLGIYSDAEPKDCGELNFIDARTEKYRGAFKTPSLRNVAERFPYMNAGQISTLREVLLFYRQNGSRELNHGALTDRELGEIERFLRTLSGPIRSY